MQITAILPLLQGAKRNGTGWTACCPAHDDQTPSLSISEGTNGTILLKCHAGCNTRDICAALKIKPADLFPESQKSQWRIAATYDYTDAAGQLLYQVCRLEPKGFRQRRPDPAKPDGWIWSLDGVSRVLYRLPEIQRDIQGGKFVFICEGEKDVAAMVQRGFTATCNPGGAGKWQDNYTETLRGADVVIIADKDKAGREHAQLVAGKLHGAAKSVRILELPDVDGKPVKDAHDFFAAGGDVGQVFDLVDAAPVWTPTLGNSSRLTLRSPDELLAMTFDDSDKILGDRLLAKGQPLVIAGAGGTGKSRLMLQGIAAIVTGRKFLAFDTGASQMKWLMLQTENSNRRLQQDLAPIKTWLGADWTKFAAQVIIHTLENDDDGFVSLDSVENQLAIQSVIEAVKPDGILIDPLNDFAAGDLNKDADMKLTLQTLSRLCRRGQPDRALVILHHSLTGKAGAQRATGYDRTSFARNSKALFAWTRGQVNLAPIDPDTNDRLAVVCGKCSNGPEFQSFAIRLNPETMIYECDPSVDVNAWANELNGKPSEPLMTPERVGELCRLVMQRGALAKAIMDDCGCSRATAYRHVARATGKTIQFNKTNETYTKK